MALVFIKGLQGEMCLVPWTPPSLPTEPGSTGSGKQGQSFSRELGLASPKPSPFFLGTAWVARSSSADALLPRS